MLALSKTLLASRMLVCVAVSCAPAALAQPSSGGLEAQPMQLLSSSATPAPPTLPPHKPSSLRPIRETVASTEVDPVAVDQDYNDVREFSGQLHFKINGNPHYCSGVFVTKSVILTAAHCVQQNGTTANYQLERFVRDGTNNHQIKKDFYNKDCIRVPVEWSTQTDEYLRIDYDYAFLRIADTDVLTTAPKVSLVTMDVGKDSIRAYGYPASKSQVFTAIAENVTPDLLHPNLRAVDTKSLGFTEGTSGGAWVWRPGGGGGGSLRVVSVNSSYAVPVYDKSKIWIYGPSFTRPKKRNTEKTAQELLAELDKPENCQ